MGNLEERLEKAVIDIANRKKQVQSQSIENRQGVISEFTENKEKIDVEIEQLKQQLKFVDEQKTQIKEEMDDFLDKNSGFYQDIQQEFNDKDKEAEEIKAKIEVKNREVSVLEKQADQEKEKIEQNNMKQEDLLREELENVKVEVISELEKKLKLIDENRKVKIDGNLDDLKKEKEELEKQIAFNDLSKEEIEALDSNKKKEVLLGRERYLLNKKRLSEITPKIEILEALDGQEPKKRYLEIMSIIAGIKKNLTFENLEERVPKIEKEEKYSQKEKENVTTIDREEIIVPKIENVDIFIDEETEKMYGFSQFYEEQEEINLKIEQEDVEQEARESAEQEARMKAEQEARMKAEQEARMKAEQEARMKAEQEARMKTEQEARMKAEQEARMKAEQEARMKAEQEAKAKAEQEDKVKAEREANKNSSKEENKSSKNENLNIIYTVQKDMYECKNVDMKINKWKRKSLQNLGPEFDSILGNILEEHKIDTEIMSQIDSNVLAVGLVYDFEHKTEKISYVLELQKVLKEGLKGRELKKHMKEVLKESGVNIEYDLRGLYDNIDGKGYSFSDEERWEILQKANKLKELGIANVRKGLKVSVMEKIENLINVINRNKNEKLSEGKDSDEKTTDSVEGYENLTNAEYLKSIDKAFEEAKREEAAKREVKNKPKKQNVNFKGNLSENIVKVKGALNKVVSGIKDKGEELKERLKVSPEVQSYLDNVIKKAGKETKNNGIHKLRKDEAEIVKGSHNFEGR